MTNGERQLLMLVATIVLGEIPDNDPKRNEILDLFRAMDVYHEEIKG